MSQDALLPPTLDYHPVPSGDREPGVGRTLAWFVIIASVLALGFTNWREARLSAAATAGEPAGITIELIGRYIVGANSLIVQQPNAASIMVAEVNMGAKTEVDRVAAVTIIAELQGKPAALARLDELQKTLPPELTPPTKALKKLYTKGAKDLSPDDRAALNDRLGWCGKLALTFEQPASDSQRAAVLADGQRTMFVIAGVGVMVFLALIVGLILLIILLVLFLDRRMLRYYRPPTSGSSRLLQAFAIYIGGMTVADLALPFMPGLIQKSIVAHVGLMFGPLIIAMCWPMLRGVQGWRAAFGWHTGAGVFREIGLGLTGYIAGLPVLAGGFFITAMLINATGAHPSHPIEHMLGVSRTMTIIVLCLASIYAPLTEETMFRGALFSGLRARHGWFLSAIFSSFIFAAVHPQGWTVVPALMSIAIVLAAIREWRGTVLSSAAAHCLHNTVVLVVALLMMS